MCTSNKIGQAGERRSGIPKGKKKVFEINGRSRIPDYTNTQLKFIVEVKNVKATPHNAIKEKNGEQPTRKQLEALLNLFARQQQIKPSDRVCQRGSDLPMRAGYSLLQFAFASLGIVSFGIEAGASKPQRHVRLWHEPKISHARAA